MGVAVVGKPDELNYAEIWEKRYMPMDAQLKSYSIDDGCYGITFNEDGHNFYLAGVAIKGQSEPHEGTEIRRIPAATYAVFECGISQLGAMMQEIYGQWFHASDKEPDPDGVGFEYYLPYNGHGEMQVAVYIPVKAKVPARINQQGAELKVLSAIRNRRSIRKFKSDPIPESILHQILQAALMAPSGKNRQPWKFYVVQGEKRNEMIDHMHAGISRLESAGYDTGSAKYTLKVMEQAPVTVFVYNPGGLPPWETHSIDETISDIVDIQSIGAAIQNMLLTAEELGLGSLWICDVFSAYEELSTWLGERSEMIAAVSFGVADEHPIARKRKSFDEVVQWV